MRIAPDVWQPVRRIVACPAAMLLLITLTAVVLPGSAAAQTPQPPEAQGVQFGHPLDLNTLDPVTGTCKRSADVDLLLGDQDVLERTSWIRINFRAAGGMYPGNPNAVIACPGTLDEAYQAILDDFANAAGWIQVIGLMTQDMWYGSYERQEQLNYDAVGFAEAAGAVACRPAYDHVDVWEIWNEPDLNAVTSAYLSPEVYASVLGLASREIRDCGTGDLVISAGLVPDYPDQTAYGLIDYLFLVDGNIDAFSHGGYTGLSDAVDGIGIHPYVAGINLGDSGHGYLDGFLTQVADALHALNAADKPLYATEFGWPIVAGMDQERRCRNLVNAFEVMDAWAGGQGADSVAAAVWFTFQDSPGATDKFGLYDLQANARLARTGYTTGTCPPIGPSNPTATALTGTQIQVGWADNSHTETGFEVDNGITSVTVAPNATSYTWGGLSPGASMCFRVRSFNADGYSPYTTWACTTTMTPPTAPSNAAATPLSGISIRITWQDNSTDETGFRVKNDVTTVTVPANTTSYTWSGLSPGTSMCFRIRSFNNAGASAATPLVCATTPAPPAAPSNPTATAVNGTSIHITWQDNSTDESGFGIFNGATTVTVAANTTSYTWDGLSQGTYMCFAIYAYNTAGSSAMTPYACATTPTVPAPPSNPTATAVNGTSIHITWQDNSTDESGFRVKNDVTTVTVPANTTSYTWSGLSPGTSMCFRIRSFNNAGASAATPLVCATTPAPPAAPSSPAAVAVSPYSILVMWQDNSTDEVVFEINNGVTARFVDANTTSYTWTDLSPGTYMCFRVRASNYAGSSAYTDWTCATTPAPPAAPSSPTAVAISTNSINIMWQDNSTDEVGFEITNGVSSTFVGANTTSYTWTGLSPGTYMCFRIRAYNPVGSSAYTDWTCATTAPPAAPSSPAAVAVSPYSILVMWQDNSTDEVVFEIDNGVTARFAVANSTSYTWTDLSPGTYMCFRVRASNYVGSSAYTNWTCATTYLSAAATAYQRHAQ